MPLSRRDVLKLGAGASAALLLDVLPAGAQQPRLITKPIPSSGEQIPVIGLGSSQTFNLTVDHPEYAEAREVLRLFPELGGRLIDTSPTYQRSEIFIGETLQELGNVDRYFIATKVNVGNGGKHAALEQMENSLRAYGRKSIDLIQVWNLGGSIQRLSAATLGDHMEALREFRAAGKIRYLGITTSRDPQYADTEEAMRTWPMDFVQLDYSIGDRIPEQRLLPLAKERGIAVIANRPFTTGNLFSRVAGRALPPWAEEFDCRSWAQFFLKFIVSHPAVTCAIPATNDPAHLRDNMGACVGRLPDEVMRVRMAQHFASL
jgi:aryl-alcohol dehydrogenase-like predicted oxidoreductase